MPAMWKGLFNTVGLAKTRQESSRETGGSQSQVPHLQLPDDLRLQPQEAPQRGPQNIRLVVVEPHLDPIVLRNLYRKCFCEL